MYRRSFWLTGAGERTIDETKTDFDVRKAYSVHFVGTSCVF
jgi:hypothetical protein